MMSTPFPQNYEQWIHCITVECGLTISPAFVEERLTVWRNEKSAETVRFRRLYGDAYWRAMIGFFEQAERDLASQKA